MQPWWAEETLDMLIRYASSYTIWPKHMLTLPLNNTFSCFSYITNRCNKSIIQPQNTCRHCYRIPPVMCFTESSVEDAQSWTPPNTLQMTVLHSPNTCGRVVWGSTYFWTRFVCDGMTFTTVWIQNALGNRWWIVKMPVCTDLTSTQASRVCVQVCCRHASWDETGATRPRQAVSSAPVAVLSEQTPSNVSLWRRARERDGKSSCQSRTLPSLQRSAADELEILCA